MVKADLRCTQVEPVDDTETSLRSSYTSATAERERVELDLKASKAKEQGARAALLKYMRENSAIFKQK